MTTHGTSQNRPETGDLVESADLRCPPPMARQSDSAERRAVPSQLDSHPGEDLPDDALVAWEERLHVAVDDLRQREQQALAHEMTPGELLAFAAEYDKIALDRDNIAESYDERSIERDRAGLRRDVKGSARDRDARAVAQDQDEGFPDRSLAGQDRDYAAGDRADSHDDRARSRRARETAAADRTAAAGGRERAAENATALQRELDGLRKAIETRATIGQAQGMLMARHNLSPETAFAVLVRLSQDSNTKLRDLAASVVEAAQTNRD